MAEDKDFSIDVGMSPETVMKIADLGRRFEGWKAKNIESHTGPPPPSPKSPMARNLRLDEEVGLDKPIRGNRFTTPRDISEGASGGLASRAKPVNVREVRRTRSLRGRRT